MLDLAALGAAAQQAKAGARSRPEHVFAVLVDQVVFPVAQEREVSVVQPGEQFPGLLKVRYTGTGRGEFTGDLVDFGPHAGPVPDGHTDIVQDLQEPVDHVLAPCLISQPRNLNGDPGLDAGGVLPAADQSGNVRQRGRVTAGNTRSIRHPLDLLQGVAVPVAGCQERGVDHQPDAAVLADDFGRDRIDEEGHVIGNDEDDAGVTLVKKIYGCLALCAGPGQ